MWVKPCMRKVKGKWTLLYSDKLYNETTTKEFPSFEFGIRMINFLIRKGQVELKTFEKRRKWDALAKQLRMEREKICI